MWPMILIAIESLHANPTWFNYKVLEAGVE